MQKGLAYSNQALENRLIFLSDDSNILIIVEDRGKEYEYDFIFKKMFDNINIGFLAMGGKKGVKKLFKKHPVEYERKPLLYLVDGDFEILLNDNLINHSNFIYLKKYNFESYFINKNSICNFVTLKMKKTESDAMKLFNYDHWLNNTYSHFKELFLYFAIVQDHPDRLSDKKNVGLGAYYFLKDDGSINEDKIREYKEGVKLLLSNIDLLVSNMEKKFDENLEGDCSRLICGKYIIDCLLNHLKCKFKLKISDTELRNHLLDNFNINDFNYIKDKINEIII